MCFFWGGCGCVYGGGGGFLCYIEPSGVSVRLMFNRSNIDHGQWTTSIYLLLINLFVCWLVSWYVGWFLTRSFRWYLLHFYVLRASINKLFRQGSVIYTVQSLWYISWGGGGGASCNWWAVAPIIKWVACGGPTRGRKHIRRELWS